MILVITIFAVIIQCAGCEFGGVALGGFMFLALCSFARAFGAVLFPCVEDRLEPRQHFIERRQTAWRSLFAARALRTDSALLALNALFTARPLHAGFALWTRFAIRSRLARQSRLALRTGLSLRTLRSRLALRAGFPRLARFAAGAFRAGTAGMTLRAGMSGLALWPLRPWPRLPRRIFRHLCNSMIPRYAFSNSVWMTASIRRL
jgi:hypothetical protein